jgi:hypothetical protein
MCRRYAAQAPLASVISIGMAAPYKNMLEIGL